MKKKTRDDGSTYWELTTEEDISPMMLPLHFPTPEYPRNNQQQIFYIVGDGKDIREGLTELLLVRKEAQFRFKDTSLEGMLKGAIVKKVLEDKDLNPEELYPYLEAQVSSAVSNGRYLRSYQCLKKQARQDGKPIRMSSLLKEMGLLQNANQQHSLYLKTGFYVQKGMLYAGTQAKPIENLTQYIGSRK